jgi:hypothetical protein
MNRSDESLADAILRALPPTDECRGLRRADAMIVVRSIYRGVSAHNIRVPNVRPYVVGQMLALCIRFMGPVPLRPVCKHFQTGFCRAGQRCQFDHCGLPDDFELLRAMCR